MNRICLLILSLITIAGITIAQINTQDNSWIDPDTSGDFNPQDYIIDEHGNIQWNETYMACIKNAAKVSDTKKTTTYALLDFYKYKNERFCESEYKKFQHFDLWKLEGYGNVDSTVYLYVRKRANNIVIRFSDNLNEPIVILKTKYGWVLDYEYLIDPEMYEWYDVYICRRTIGFLSDSVNIFINEFSDDNPALPHFVSAWVADKQSSRYVLNLELEKPQFFDQTENKPFILRRGFKQCVELLLKTPKQYFPKKVEVASMRRYMNSKDEFFIDVNGKENHNNIPLIIGAGGMLNKRNFQNNIFIYQCLPPVKK